MKTRLYMRQLLKMYLFLLHRLAFGWLIILRFRLFDTSKPFMKCFKSFYRDLGHIQNRIGCCYGWISIWTDFWMFELNIINEILDLLLCASWKCFHGTRRFQSICSLLGYSIRALFIKVVTRKENSFYSKYLYSWRTFL